MLVIFGQSIIALIGCDGAELIPVSSKLYRTAVLLDMINLMKLNGLDRLTKGYFPLDMHLNRAWNTYIEELLAKKIFTMHREGAIVQRHGCHE